MIGLEKHTQDVPNVLEGEKPGEKSKLPGSSPKERLQQILDSIKEHVKQDLDEADSGEKNPLPLPGGEWRTDGPGERIQRIRDAIREDVEALAHGDEADGERKPNSIVNIEGERYRTDDNGVPYARYNPETKEYELLPNSKYTLNGYDYYTDAQGRQVKVEGNLHLKDEEGRKPINDDVPDKEPGDERGHIIGDQFDGSNLRGNLVAMGFDLNRSGYKELENKLRKEIEDGNEVTVRIELKYEGDSQRPTKIVVTYTINGEVFKETFPNETGGKV